MSYVLDTSALMALLFDEPGAERVQTILEGKEEALLPFITMMELRYVLLRRLGPEKTSEIVQTLRATDAQAVESDAEWGVAAAEVKARGGLSIADAWNAALAVRRRSTLVHKDPEFEGVAGLKALDLR